jgi:transposase-like protein
MYILPKCQNSSCLYHGKHDPSIVIKKGQDKRKHGKPVQRYQCKACGHKFTSASLTDNHFHKPELLKEIFLRYTSGYSISRLSEELEIHKETVLKAIEYLGEKCKTYHYELMRTGFLNTDKIFFDEMESYIHSKVYPVSLGLAVDVQYKRIIDIRVAEIRLKGALKKKVLDDCNGVLPAKIARRPNNAPAMMLELMKSINMTLRPPAGELFSDSKRAYITLVRNNLPAWVDYKPEKSRTKLQDHSDPQALGRFNEIF